VSGVTTAPWIETVPPQDADGVLGEAYGWQAQRLGEPAEFTLLGSLYPDLVLERLRLYKVVDETPSALTHEERLLIAFTVSLLNRTPHCSSGLLHKLRDAGVPEGVISDIEDDPGSPLTGNIRLDHILLYAGKLTRTPGDITQGDIEVLRRSGLSDLDILDVNNLAAYYNYINRVANGLGLRSTIPVEHALNSVPS
jgi:uncharacterized peroxidase-related enzyme